MDLSYTGDKPLVSGFPTWSLQGIKSITGTAERTKRNCHFELCYAMTVAAHHQPTAH